jgi:hypothetical protein
MSGLNRPIVWSAHRETGREHGLPEGDLGLLPTREHSGGGETG